MRTESCDLIGTMREIRVRRAFAPLLALAYIALADGTAAGLGSSSLAARGIPASRALSEIRFTQSGEVFERFESSLLRSRVTSAIGLESGVFALGRANSGLKGSEINEALNLLRKDIIRDQRFLIEPPPGTAVIGPRAISGGTDVEVLFPFGVPPGSVRGPFDAPY